MRLFLRLRAIVVVAIKRLLAQPLLTASTTLGLIVAVALMLTVPLYAEAVSFRILTERLAEREDQSNRPPFAYLFSYIGAWARPIDYNEALVVENYLREQGATELGLQLKQFVRHYETERLRLYPADTTNYENEQRIMAYMTIGTTERIEKHIEFVEGRFPALASTDPNSEVEVAITEDFAAETGIQAGERLVVYNSKLESSNSQQIIPVRVVGIWHAIDPEDEYWFYRPLAFDDMLLVSADTFTERIGAYTDTEVNLGVWYLVTDGSGIGTTQVADLIERNDKVEQRIDTMLPGTYVPLSPVDELIPYKRTADRLMVLLTAFSIPIVILLLIFITLVIGLSVEQRRNENAVLRSRGSSPFQVIGLAAVEGFLLGLVALVIGTALAVVLTQLMGSVRSFMDFHGISRLTILFPPLAFVTAGLAVALSVIIHVISTVAAARHTIVSYKLERARVQQRPLWQRLGVDILLLIVTGYFYYVLVQQGNLFLSDSRTAFVEETFSNPFLLLLPSLTIFATTLFLLRLLSVIMRFIGWLLQLTDNVGLLIATRHLERTPGYYFHPTILLVCTISLGIFTASFARTLDRSLFEQQFYRLAGNLAARVYILSNPDSPQSFEQAFLDISEIRNAPGVDLATRVGEYAMTVQQSGANATGLFIGVDRSEFGKVSFWRPDFAHERLGTLLNALAYNNDAVLVSRNFIEANALQIGDFVRLDLRVHGVIIPLSVQLVGVVDYFPRWYPGTDDVLFVGNLDYVFEQAGTELEHTVIIRTTPDVDYREFQRYLIRKGATVVTMREPYTAIERGQAQADRQGLFGLLSIGFIASSVVTILGFFLYALFSYRRRFVELGVLRAVGLTRSEMMLSVAWELGLLVVTGLTLGISIGVGVSQMYIPYLQIGTRERELMPPYLVAMAWPEIVQILALFFILFVVSLVVLIIVLRRMKIFQAVKLGETV